MCLIAIAYHAHERYPLIVAANRDEFTDRPARPLHFWDDAPGILAGRDLKAGGTWMGVTSEGRFAAITNHRDLRRQPKAGPSRGLLVKQVLETGALPDISILEGFNLIHGHWRRLNYVNNVDGTAIELPEGVHGLSNAFLNTPWPKVERAKRAMQRIVQQEVPRMEDLFELLANEDRAADEELPETGIDREWERALSAVRIKVEGYGTRCSTVLLIDRKGRALIEERTLDVEVPVRTSYELDLNTDPTAFQRS